MDDCDGEGLCGDFEDTTNSCDNLTVRNWGKRFWHKGPLADLGGGGGGGGGARPARAPPFAWHPSF